VADTRTFTELTRQLDYPMFIVTTASEGERDGCLIGFSSQVSIKPPRFLACLSVKNRTYRIAARAETLIVHFVPEDAAELAEHFGGETGDELDKFAEVGWREGPGGAPIVAALENWFAGRILQRLDLGDHCGFLLEPMDGHAGRSETPLTFQRAKWIEPGHRP
jgi:flavin reductase (DIM6/NTAB) family NADH-FMN oxidoreductase RutF